MVTQQEAEDFAVLMFEDIIQNGKTQEMEPYYTTDFCGHYMNQDFAFEDVQERARILHDQTKKCTFKVEKVMVFGNFIVSRTNLIWISKSTETLYQSIQVTLWLMRGKKIKESWIILDRKTSSFQEINQDFENQIDPFKVNIKNKQEYIDALDLVLDTYSYGLQKPINLSNIQKDCIYYYLNGFSSRETAAELNLSARTVEKYMLQIKEVFDCTNRFELRKKLFP